ncbi:MAG: PP2C family protein-serine/threonine phosphatase [Candidatus Polarisedimenticolia bacterium]
MALLAAALLVLRVVAGGTLLFGDHAAGVLLRLLAILLPAVAIIYYSARGLGWLWRRLLWRVRRRLVITYLFVGLTPILLMGLLGFVAAFGISGEGMASVVRVQVDALARQALVASRLVAADLERLPPETPVERTARLLEERAAALQPFLPGLQFTLDPALPAWLDGRAEWSGLTAGAPGEFALRAVLAAEGCGRPLRILAEMAVGPAIVSHLRGVTGIAIQEGLADGPSAAARAAPPAAPEVAARTGLEPEPVQYVVIMPAADWTTGAPGERALFLFSWSWAEAGRQLFGSGRAGAVWRMALLILGAVFLGLEILALFVAAWMTRAVTGTVHELYVATGHIDRGDFSHRSRVRSGDQLGELAQAFNSMAAHIETLLMERVERERMQRELEIAASVQAGLFPRRAPVLETVEIAGECRAARGVAGDFYDYLEIGPGRVAVALGDVSGKGISAALLMSNLQAALRAQALFLGSRAEQEDGGHGGSGIARLASLVNRQLCATVDSNRYATLFLGLYDDRTRRLVYTNAGHNPPILLNSDGRLARLHEGGAIVGAFSDARYQQAEAHIPPGAVLLLYSDGLSEAQNAAGEEFGETRLTDLVRRHSAAAVDELRVAVFDAIDSWSGGRERLDDQTLVVVKGREVYSS